MTKGNPKVSIRFEPHYLSRIRAISEDLGLTLSEFLRGIIIGYLSGK